jgi:hypothetical protein
MRRRDFIRLLSGTAAAWPLSAHTQQSTKRLIGVLSNPSGDSFEALFPAFHRGLSESGYVEGQNVAIEYRFADGQVGRLPALAADLVNRNIAVLVAFTNPTALAAKLATTTIPIVFIIGGDPVKLGLVSSLNRPAGNITGITFFSTQTESKRLGLLHELIPHAKLIAVLINPSQPAAAAFMPATASWRGLADPFDPMESLRHPAAYLRELLDRFGNLELAAAAYNAGPARVARASRRKGFWGIRICALCPASLRAAGIAQSPSVASMEKENPVQDPLPPHLTLAHPSFAPTRTPC